MTSGIQLAREAIAAVAISHPSSCICTTCRAASGDVDAFVQVLIAVSDLELAEQLAEPRPARPSPMVGEMRGRSAADRNPTDAVEKE